MELEIKKGKAIARFNTLGGELISYSNNDIEYIWNGNKELWASHSPVLFPTVGSLINKETEINGVKYQFRKHGFARKSEFKLVKQTADSVIFSLSADDETRKSYPFEFELVVTHTISDTGFITEYKVINQDNKEILYGIGGHTGFNCPMFPNTQFNDYYILYNKVESGPFYYTNPSDAEGIIHKEDRINNLEGKRELKLNYNLFDRDVIIIEQLKSSAIKLLNTKNKKGIEFIMKGFNSIGFWTPPKKNAPFICLEPWTVIPDFSDNSGVFNEKPNITKLAIGESSSVSYAMRII